MRAIMREGISTNRFCHPIADCLVAAGKQFVIRYHSRTTQQAQKRISPQEAAELARSGLDVATVYQDNARTTADFSFARGRLDGTSAQTFAAQIGQPAASAIYFAVDADFSAPEVDRFVLPYFAGVKEGLDETADGSSGYRIGVYGSGLVCAKVRDDGGLARFAWLAEARGWRGSATYATWDVRQHVNAGAELCGLGAAWERCEAGDTFGQFRPIGFDVRADAGALMRVTAAQLNLRRAPTTTSVPALAQLQEGQLVRVLGRAVEPWVRVRLTLGGSDAIGYVSGKFLAPVAGRAAAATGTVVPPTLKTPNAVHYHENDPLSRRASTAKRAQPLGESPRPARSPTATPTERVTQLGQIVQWLAVDTSVRYKPEPPLTYCNIYAADYGYLAGAYLPRTWWTETALMQIAAGAAPPVTYGSTIREMRADDLYAWLVQFGPNFGWRRVFDASALQETADRGGVGVICADRDAEGRAGHISVVVPQTPTELAVHDADGHVVVPLQSQAGAVNFRYSSANPAPRAWWEDAIYRAWGFFVHP
jgi:hypothetical protein